MSSGKSQTSTTASSAYCAAGALPQPRAPLELYFDLLSREATRDSPEPGGNALRAGGGRTCATCAVAFDQVSMARRRGSPKLAGAPNCVAVSAVSFTCPDAAGFYLLASEKHCESTRAAAARGRLRGRGPRVQLPSERRR